MSSDEWLVTYFEELVTTLHVHGMHLRHADRNWHYPSHEHMFYEVNYVIEGRQTFTVNGRTFHQSIGDVLFIPPGCIHFARADSEKFSYFCFHFTIDEVELLPVFGPDMEVYFPKGSLLVSKVAPLLDRLLDLERNRDQNSIPFKLRTQSIVFELLAELYHCLSLHQESISTAQDYASIAVLVATEIEAWHSAVFHGRAKPDKRSHHAIIADITDRLGLSYTQCNRIFKQRYGISPRQYLSNCILREAKQLLGRSEVSVELVAELLGYTSASHFSRQFKRWSGVCPSEYREKALASKRSQSPSPLSEPANEW